MIVILIKTRTVVALYKNGQKNHMILTDRIEVTVKTLK